MSDNAIEIVNKDYTFELLQNNYEIYVENVYSIDYNMSSNMPSINNVTLKGNKTLTELGIQEKGNYASCSLNNLDAQGQTIINSKANKATNLSGYGILDGANINANNFTVTGKSNIVNFVMPSANLQQFNIGASGTIYTAERGGWVKAKATSTGAGYIYLWDESNGFENYITTSISGINLYLYIPITSSHRFGFAYDAVTPISLVIHNGNGVS